MGDYYSNTAAYAKNCINKAKPQMHCNGKCQMMKKLKAQEKKDQQNPERRNSKEDVLSSKSFFVSLNIITTHSRILYHNADSGVPVKRSHTFFHPPTA